MRLFRSGKSTFAVLLAVGAALLSGAASFVFGVCGPFTDVSDAGFCPFVLEIFTLGITTGTTPTTYAPADNVTRLQMAAFLSRSVDATLRRGSRRAALDQFWTPQNAGILGLTTVGGTPTFVKSDGLDLWVSKDVGSVSRVRGSDGALLATWTGSGGSGIVVAMSRVFVAGGGSPGRLLRLDPGLPPGALTTVASDLGGSPATLTFDGAKFWTANQQPPRSVSIVFPGSSIPFASITVTAGFNTPGGAVYDGANVWVTDFAAGTLLRLDGSAGILQTVTVGLNPLYPAFDGTNIWVPNLGSASVSVVRASTGVVLSTLTGNGLTFASEAAFDGQRVMVTNFTGNTVSLWKAADLAPLGFFAVSGSPIHVCSDGINFWISLSASGHLARF